MIDGWVHRGRASVARVLSSAIVAGTLAAGCGDGDRHESDGGAPAASPDVLLRDDALDFSEPAMAAARGGDLAVVWLAFDGGRDRVMAALRRGDAWTRPIVVNPDSATNAHFAPRVAATSDGDFAVVWSAWDGEQSDVFAARIDAGRVGTPVRVASEAGDDVAPCVLGAPDGSVWIAWQSRRDGRFDIRARTWTDGAFGTEIRVTDDPASDVQPVLGSGADGSIWAAWTSFRDGRYADGNYEVYARRLDRDAPAVRVSSSPQSDMLPTFVAGARVPALAWTRSRFPAIAIGDLRAVAYDEWLGKTYQVARMDGGAFSPSVELRLSPDRAMGSVASVQPIAIRGADEGDVWLLYGDRVVRGAFDRRWVLRVARLAGDVASGPLDLSDGVASTVARYAAAWSEGALWVVDEIESAARDAATPPRAALRVRRIDPSRLHGFPPAKAFRAPEDPLVDPALALEEGPGTRPSVAQGGSAWQAYWGNLHVHSDLSADRRGFEGRPEDNFQVVEDIARLDFAALTDHAETMRPVDWWATRKLTDAWNRDGRFVALPAYEWTSLEYGHRNVFFPDTAVADESVRIEAHPGSTPDALFRGLGSRRAIVVPHHPSHAFAKAVDWSFRNDHFQRLVEIFQKRGDYEYDGAPVADIRAQFVPGHSVRDALAMGHRLGIIASPDHGGGLGLAGVWTSELSQRAVFEALEARRTFGTTGAKMALFLTVAGAVQGSEIARPAGPIALHATVQATKPGLELTVVRNGEEVKQFASDAASADVDWVDPSAPSGSTYYYLRARQLDGHTGWTSPVWLEASPQP